MDDSKLAECAKSLRRSEMRRPENPLQNMSHWKHIGSTKSPRFFKERDDVDLCKEKFNIERQFQKLEAIGMENKKATKGSFHVMSDALNTVGGMITEKAITNFVDGYPARERNSAFERTILSKTCVCRMDSSCVDLKVIDSSPFSHSDVATSKWQTYQKLNVKQRVQGIMTSKRKFGFWDATLGKDQLHTSKSEFSPSSDKVKSMPGNFMFQQGYTLQYNRLCQFFEKNRPSQTGGRQNDCVGVIPGYDLCLLSSMDAPIDENISSMFGASCKQTLTDCSCLYVEKELCNSCNHFFCKFVPKRNNEKLSMEDSWPIPRSHSPKVDGTSKAVVSDGDILFVKRSETQGFMGLNESQQRFQQTFPSLSISKHEECANIDSSGRPLEIYDTNEKVGTRSINVCSTRLENNSDIKTACLKIGAQEDRSLPQAMASAKPDHKDAIITESQKQKVFKSGLDMQLKESLINVQEAGFHDGVPCTSSDEVNPKRLQASSTDTMETEHPVSDAIKPEKPWELTDHIDTDARSRWVKRLKVDSDSVAICTRDGRDCHSGDILTTRRVPNLRSKVLNYSRLNSLTLAKCFQEHRQFQKTMLLLKDTNSPLESLIESQPWIQRWCHRREESVHTKTIKPVEVLCEPEKTKPLPENLEGKLFPSLAAMALMGKTFSNFRPCEFRRRGSSLVWNTEGL